MLVCFTFVYENVGDTKTFRWLQPAYEECEGWSYSLGELKKKRIPEGQNEIPCGQKFTLKGREIWELSASLLLNDPFRFSEVEILHADTVQVREIYFREV